MYLLLKSYMSYSMIIQNLKNMKIYRWCIPQWLKNVKIYQYPLKIKQVDKETSIKILSIQTKHIIDLKTNKLYRKIFVETELSSNRLKQFHKISKYY